MMDVIVTKSIGHQKIEASDCYGKHAVIHTLSLSPISTFENHCLAARKYCEEMGLHNVKLVVGSAGNLIPDALIWTVVTVDQIIIE